MTRRTVTTTRSKAKSNTVLFRNERHFTSPKLLVVVTVLLVILGFILLFLLLVVAVGGSVVRSNVNTACQNWLNSVTIHDEWSYDKNLQYFIGAFIASEADEVLKVLVVRPFIMNSDRV
jgi:uncharacterized metal-binding protein